MAKASSGAGLGGRSARLYKNKQHLSPIQSAHKEYSKSRYVRLIGESIEAELAAKVKAQRA